MFRRLSALGILAAVVVTASLAEPPAKATPKFIRFEKTPTGGLLQTSVVHFVRADGAKVDLIGAVHLGEEAYYSDLNHRFSDYQSVLYEMVKPKDYKPGQPRPTSAPASATLAAVGLLQKTLTNTLQLQFQLEGVDYLAPNFVHADLDSETFLAKQQERGESVFKMMLESSMKQMDAKVQSTFGVMDVIKALRSPDSAQRLKLLLAEQFGHLDEMMAMTEGPDGSVILTERNRVAMDVLKTELTGGKKHLAVFYGAAHLQGMSDILTNDMGFKQVGDPEWLTAWDARVSTTQPATAK